MYIMIREATGARDLEPLIPVLKNIRQENAFCNR